MRFTWINLLNPFQPSVEFLEETSHLVWNAYQMTGFYMKSNTGMKWLTFPWISSNFRAGPNQGGQAAAYIYKSTHFLEIIKLFILNYDTLATCLISSWIYKKNSVKCLASSSYNKDILDRILFRKMSNIKMELSSTNAIHKNL